MPRFELPGDLTPEEERIVVGAIEQYLDRANVHPPPWALAGRAGGLGLGALQVRNQSRHPFTETRLNHYTRLGTESYMGRGDAK